MNLLYLGREFGHRKETPFPKKTSEKIPRPSSETRKIRNIPLKNLERIFREFETQKTENEKDIWRQLENLKELLRDFMQDESSKSLPDLEKIDLTNITKKFSILLVAVNIMSFSLSRSAESKVFNKNESNLKTIEWAQEALEKIDPMEYLIYKKSEKAKASPIYLFDDSDKKMLTWNLYHEIRGGLSEQEGGLESILGVFYSVFERMNSGKHGGDPKSVILQQSQYSWTLEILRDLHKKNIDPEVYIKLRTLVEKYTQFPFIVAHEELKKDLETLINAGKDRKISLPENMNDYHLFGMLSPEKDINKKYSQNASKNTKARILKAEELYKNGSPLVVKLGRHLHYNSAKIDQLIKGQK